MKIRLDWYWGLAGMLGLLGFALNQPRWYVFFLFFAAPVLKKGKK